MMVDVGLIKVFATVAQLQSFSKAAALLGVTQSAVSQSVAQLEKFYRVRLFDRSVPKKVRRLALKSVLTSKVQENEIVVLDALKLDAPKTKDMIKVLENVKAGKKALIVTAEKDENIVKSAANIPGVRTALVGTMNVYEIINHESFIVTQEAVKKIEEVYA